MQDFGPMTFTQKIDKKSNGCPDCVWFRQKLRMSWKRLFALL